MARQYFGVTVPGAAIGSVVMGTSTTGRNVEISVLSGVSGNSKAEVIKALLALKAHVELNDIDTAADTTPAPSYSNEATALFAAFTTPPTTAHKARVDACIVALKAAGIWADLDLLYMPAAHNATDWKLNWKSPGANSLVDSGGVEFRQYGGVRGDGTSKAFYGPNMSTLGGQFSRNDASILVAVTANDLESKSDMKYLVGKGDSGSTETLSMRPYSNGAFFSGRLNSTAVLGGPITNIVTREILAFDRSVSSTLDQYRNGDKVVSAATQASAALVNDFTWFDRDGSAYTDMLIGCICIGKALGATKHKTLANIITAYLGSPGDNDHFSQDGCSYPLQPGTYPSGIYVPSTHTTWMAWESYNNSPSILFREQKIVSYDHTNQRWGRARVYHAGTGLLSNDSHGVPALVRDDEGYIHTFYGPHNGDLHHRHSAAPDDFSNYVVESDLTDFDWAYPKPFLWNGQIYVIGRHAVAATNRYYGVYRKTTALSGGVPTWGTGVIFCDMGDDTRYYNEGHYEMVGSHEVHFVATHSDFSGNAFKDVFYFILDLNDGSIWNRARNTQVAEVDFPITRTQCDASFRIFNHSGIGSGYATQTSGFGLPYHCQDTAGNAHVCYMTQSADQTTKSFWHMMWPAGGSAWSTPFAFAVDVVAGHIPRFIPMSDGSIRVIWLENPGLYPGNGAGKMRQRDRSAAGVWTSSIDLFVPSGSWGVQGANHIRFAPDTSNWFTFESTESETHEVGTLKGYLAGSNGFIKGPIWTWPAGSQA